MRAPWTVAISLGLAAGGLFVLATPRPGSAAPAEMRIGVVDILSVLSTSDAKRAMDQRFRDDQDRVTKYAQDEEKKLNDEASNLDAMVPKSDPKRRDREEDLLRRKAALQAEVKIRAAHAEDDYTRARARLYEDVRDAVQKVAREGGYTLVLVKVSDPLDLRGSSTSEFVLNVAMRPVLYADAAVDLTQTVVERVKAMRPPSPPTPPSGPPPAPPPGPPPVPPASGPGAPGGPTGPGMDGK